MSPQSLIYSEVELLECDWLLRMLHLQWINPLITWWLNVGMRSDWRKWVTGVVTQMGVFLFPPPDVLPATSWPPGVEHLASAKPFQCAISTLEPADHSWAQPSKTEAKISCSSFKLQRFGILSGKWLIQRHWRAVFALCRSVCSWKLSSQEVGPWAPVLCVNL